MIIVNAIVYNLSAPYSILSFNQLFNIEISPYWFLAKISGIVENMIFSLIAENQENMIFMLSVFTKILFFIQCHSFRKETLLINSTHFYFAISYQNKNIMEDVSRDNLSLLKLGQWGWKKLIVRWFVISKRNCYSMWLFLLK